MKTVSKKPKLKKVKSKTKDEPKLVQRYAVYNAIHLALRGDGFKVPAGLGGYLMDKFIRATNPVPIIAEEVIEKGFCTGKKGDLFSDWRAALVDKQWLQYDHATALTAKTIGACAPGKRLNRYLTKEKILNKNIVTTDMLDDVKQHVDARVDVLQDLLKNLIEIVDPPYTPEKGEEYGSNTKVLVDAIATKILENGETSRPNHPDYSKSLKN